MVFIGKPNKSLSIPLNYRPICLIELLIKIFDKIIANRLQYYIEYNNLASERQFGFRPNRGTQHSIALITTAITENTDQRFSTFLATRDVEKAFDTVWFPGLLYKINQLPNINTDFTALMFNFLTT